VARWAQSAHCARVLIVVWPRKNAPFVRYSTSYTSSIYLGNYRVVQYLHHAVMWKTENRLREYPIRVFQRIPENTGSNFTERSNRELTSFHPSGQLANHAKHPTHRHQLTDTSNCTSPTTDKPRVIHTVKVVQLVDPSIHPSIHPSIPARPAKLSAKGPKDQREREKERHKERERESGIDEHWTWGQTTSQPSSEAAFACQSIQATSRHFVVSS
jgi:hypothetical protein